MSEAAGLRERKRERTRQAISEAAITLFLARGFDQVSVAEIAAAAEVSKPTLFKYFASKEELALHRIADHREEAAAVVRARPAGQAPLAALRRRFLDGLRDRDPVTGLNDHPEVLAYHRMIFSTPSLRAPVLQHTEQDERALAEALDEGTGHTGVDAAITGRLAASQVIAVQRVLARENWRRLVDGRSADEQYGDAVAAAEHAYDLLGRAYADYYG
ncbi:TetR family transcriptional regulator [Micromonospora pisi]|uniref:TetR family transcriptional regulator n=1 Tax=Micromonospora pisi TaxID=589240 RepID=A0A495JMA1_9ACTN|nr:TetR/AcrR family transcriptional regulator [Micromonospora pisi]RKR89961.1 TetR family transcriptional regulator [Micromonospora pisi]